MEKRRLALRPDEENCAGIWDIRGVGVGEVDGVGVGVVIWIATPRRYSVDVDKVFVNYLDCK